MLLNITVASPKTNLNSINKAVSYNRTMSRNIKYVTTLMVQGTLLILSLKLLTISMSFKGNKEVVMW
jgi:hypothetical protein